LDADVAVDAFFAFESVVVSDSGGGTIVTPCPLSASGGCCCFMSLSSCACRTCLLILRFFLRAFWFDFDGVFMTSAAVMVIVFILAAMIPKDRLIGCTTRSMRCNHLVWYAMVVVVLVFVLSQELLGREGSCEED
jgi:hypothetical protein